jgi:hypothetical protein
MMARVTDGQDRCQPGAWTDDESVAVPAPPMAQIASGGKQTWTGKPQQFVASTQTPPSPQSALVEHCGALQSANPPFTQAASPSTDVAQKHPLAQVGPAQPDSAGQVVAQVPSGKQMVPSAQQMMLFGP